MSEPVEPIVVVIDDGSRLPDAVLTELAGMGVRVRSFRTPQAAVDWLTQPDPSRAVRVGAWVIDRERLTASVEGVRLPLTFQDVNFVYVLLSAPRRYQTFGDLDRRVWDQRGPRPNTLRIRSAVKRLRSKLAACEAPFEIESVRGRGYRLIDRPQQGGSAVTGG